MINLTRPLISRPSLLFVPRLPLHFLFVNVRRHLEEAFGGQAGWSQVISNTMLESTTGGFLVPDVAEARGGGSIRRNHHVLHVFLHVLVALEGRIHHASIVAEDIHLSGEFHAEAQSQVVVECLAATIGNATGAREESQARGGDYEGTLFASFFEAGDELGCEDLGTVSHVQDVDVNVTLHLLVGDRLKGTHLCPACVKDEHADIELLQGLKCALVVVNCKHLIEVSDDKLSQDSFSCQLTDLLQFLFHFCLVTPDDADVKFGIHCQILGHGEADTVRAACDHSPGSLSSIAQEGLGRVDIFVSVHSDAVVSVKPIFPLAPRSAALLVQERQQSHEGPEKLPCAND